MIHTSQLFAYNNFKLLWHNKLISNRIKRNVVENVADKANNAKF